MKALIIDSLYGEFLHSLPAFNPASSYEVELQKVMAYRFGTYDCFSRHLRALGHECIDVVSNYIPLQALWSRENGVSGDTLKAQIALHAPDVVLLQDLSLPVTRGPYLLAGQCSCPLPSAANIQKCDVIFSSLIHHCKKFESMGVRSLYLPLAFDPIVLDGPQPERDIDISFVGGIGRDAHWRSGTDTLEIIAERFQERFHWYGYYLGALPESSALRACYRGEAWGQKMYDIYRRSKIVINRHGEVAEGYANNLRMYEAAGCGAMLLTDNRTDQFNASEMAHYSTPAEAIEKLNYFLTYPNARKRIAANGQTRTLRDHTYSQRMKAVSDVLTEMRCPAYME